MVDIFPNQPPKKPARCTQRIPLCWARRGCPRFPRELVAPEASLRPAGASVVWFGWLSGPATLVWPSVLPSVAPSHITTSTAGTRGTGLLEDFDCTTA